MGSGRGGKSDLDFSSVEEPTDLATWECCAIIFFTYVTTRVSCWTLLSSSEKAAVFGVALAVGGRSLEERRLGVVAVPFAG